MAVAAAPYRLRFHISAAKALIEVREGDGKVAHTRPTGPTTRGFAAATNTTNIESKPATASGTYNFLARAGPISTKTAIPIATVTMAAAMNAVRDPDAHTPSHAATLPTVASGTRYLFERQVSNAIPPSQSAATVPLRLASYIVPPARPITPYTVSVRKLR